MRYFSAVFVLLISNVAMAQTAPKAPAPTIASLEAQVASLERALMKQKNCAAQASKPALSTTPTVTTP